MKTDMIGKNKSKREILILPCNGRSASGQITWLAAQKLVLEGKAHWYCFPLGQSRKEAVVLIDGCRERCLRHWFTNKKMSYDYYLRLDEVGIEPVVPDEISCEDIELARDAVIAECTEVAREPLVFMQSCSCR